MPVNRRQFFELLGTIGASTVVGSAQALAQSAQGAGPPSDDAMGVLVDIPNCIGCRKCEYACQKAAGFEVPPIETYDDKSVFGKERRPASTSFTVVNQYRNTADESKPLFVKVNCLHCQDPACASACLVGAFQKQPNGAVTYDAWKCMGCRYCMVACPFQIPTYEYDNPLTPQVRKCTLCFDKITNKTEVPECVRICPRDCLTYGTRGNLLRLAREKIAQNPGRYVDHIYGEHEVGGTSWLYLSSVPFEQIGFLELGSSAAPRLTESIQHGVFAGFVPPLALYGVLGMIMWLGRRSQDLPPGEAIAEVGEPSPVSTGYPKSPGRERRPKPALEPAARSLAEDVHHGRT